MARETLKASRGERAGAIAAVAAVTGGLGWLLFTALGVHAPAAVTQALASFDVSPPPPPPPPPVPPPRRPAAHAPRAAPAPPAKRAQPTPVVAPRPLVLPPVLPLVLAAPLPGRGAAASAGAAAAGTGTGAGGAGNGRGGGGEGGDGRGPWLLRGIPHGRIPPAARLLNGTVVAGLRFTVGTDGRVHACTVTRSTGYPDLDVQTCDALRKYLRYAPERDEAGRPVASEIEGTQRWSTAHGPAGDADAPDDDAD